MSLSSLSKPPIWHPEAVATPSGWADPVTGELLATIVGLQNIKQPADTAGGNAKLARVAIQGGKTVFAYNDYIVLRASFTEPVTINNGSPTITATINGRSRTFTYFLDASEQTQQTMGKVVGFTINAAGSNYAIGDVLNFSGGGGSSAKAVVKTISAGAGITALTILAGGHGYTSTPSVTVTSAHGESAVLTPIIGVSDNGSGTNILKFRYRVQAGETATAAQISFTSPVTADVSDVDVPSETPALTFTATGISKGYSVDATSPTITGVTLNNSTFITNDIIKLTVVCSKIVYVTGIPTIELTINGHAKQATYLMGSKSNTLVFSYEVLAADAATAGQFVVASVIVNGTGVTINDLPGNALVLTFTPPVVTAVTVN